MGETRTATEKTRLERHRAEFRRARFTGPLLRAEDLDREEADVVSADFREAVVGAADLDEMYERYVAVLHSWGVMCPHPQHRRRYDGLFVSDSPMSFEESRWYSCGMCGVVVINREEVKP